MFLQLWDVSVQKRLRSMTGHVARVGALSWNQYILSRYMFTTKTPCLYIFYFIPTLYWSCWFWFRLLVHYWKIHYFSGSRSGSIHHHDVRAADHLVSRIPAHTQEVCGLKWSPDGKFLASGGNDNMLHVWKTLEGLCYSDSIPVHTFSDHQAAVKVCIYEILIELKF